MFHIAGGIIVAVILLQIIDGVFKSYRETRALNRLARSDRLAEDRARERRLRMGFIEATDGTWWRSEAALEEAHYGHVHGRWERPRSGYQVVDDEWVKETDLRKAGWGLVRCPYPYHTTRSGYEPPPGDDYSIHFGQWRRDSDLIERGYRLVATDKPRNEPCRWAPQWSHLDPSAFGIKPSPSTVIFKPYPEEQAEHRRTDPAFYAVRHAWDW